MDCSENILYYGKRDNLPEKQILKAGQLEVFYDSGSLRYISLSGKELIRNIYSAVRDRNWGTLNPSITAERIEQNENAFSVRYKAHYKNQEIDFLAEYNIVGSANNTIVFTMKGRAAKSFFKNRIGFCVLHPLEGIRGVSCKISDPNNSVLEIHFPEIIAPHQPATNITSMEWENETAVCHLNFEGDVWEMEDHRNWTDSSFKTYCTPLSFPFPAKIEEGTEIIQKVIFKANVKFESERVSNECRLYLLPNDYKLPQIGTSLDDKALSENECQILRKAGLKHLRYDLKFAMADWQLKFKVAIENSRLLETPLELVLHFAENAKTEAAALRDFLADNPINLNYVWLIRQKKRLTNNELIVEVGELLRQIFPGVPIGGGTDAYFAEFNRNRFDASQLDFVTYAVCPQVHAFDNDSLVENIDAQADTVESARYLYPGKQIHISPITLKQRFNVVATGEEPPVPENQLPPQVDERQMSLFAAGWTLGSLAVLTRSGVESVTYYEAIGWRGVIQGGTENSKPSLFAANKGDIYPVYHLLRFLHGFNPEKVRSCKVSHPLRFSGLFCENDVDRIIILANHGGEFLKIYLDGVEPRKFLELSKDSMPKALRKDDFLEIAAWKDLYKDFVGLKPYSLLFVKIK